jgi:hypothetical protein
LFEQPRSKSSSNSLGTMDEHNKNDMQGEEQLSVMMTRDAASNGGRGDSNVTYANPLEQPCSNRSENLLEQPSGKSLIRWGQWISAMRRTCKGRIHRLL